MSEWKKLYGHIEQLTTHQHKQPHTHSLLELKYSYHLSIKYLFKYFVYKKDMPKINAKLHLAELKALDEKILKAQ